MCRSSTATARRSTAVGSNRSTPRKPRLRLALGHRTSLSPLRRHDAESIGDSRGRGAADQEDALGAAVSILPMHNPLRIAEEFAMVDQLSGGRRALRRRARHASDRIRGVRRRLEQRAASVCPRPWTSSCAAWSGDEFEWQGDALPVSETHGLSQAAATAASADLCDGQPRSGKFHDDRPARPSLDDLAVDRDQRGAAPAGGNLLNGAARRRAIGRRRQRCFYHVSDLRRRQRRPSAPSKSSSIGIAGAALPWRRRHLRRTIRPTSVCFGIWITTRWCATAAVVFGGPETCARILKQIIEVVGTTHIGLTFHFGGLEPG